MVQLTLYGDRQTTCTQRVLILLEELELKYDFNEVNLKNKDQKKEEYLKLQPFGKVPVIKYDEEFIFESRTILRYISQHNTEDLDLFNPIDVDIWLEVESQHFNPYISKIVYEKLFKQMNNEETDENVVKESLNSLKTVLEIYEKRFIETGNKYIAGNEYSIADISHIPYINYLIKCGSQYKSFLKEYPNTYTWLKRIFSRKAVKHVLEN